MLRVSLIVIFTFHSSLTQGKCRQLNIFMNNIILLQLRATITYADVHRRTGELETNAIFLHS